MPTTDDTNKLLWILPETLQLQCHLQASYQFVDTTRNTPATVPPPGAIRATKERLPPLMATPSQKKIQEICPLSKEEITPLQRNEDHNYKTPTMTSSRKEEEVYLAGYSDRLSACPGETVQFHVSCHAPSTQHVQACLTHSICADPNPNGPGMHEQDVSAWFSPMSFPSRRQGWKRGSWAQSSHPISLLPTTTSENRQIEMEIWSFPPSWHSLLRLRRPPFP